MSGDGTVRHALKDRKDDLYETPPVAVRALLRAVPLPQVLWEPACGPGAMVSVLREAGCTVHASDLIDYGCPDSAAGRDFLMELQVPEGPEGKVEAIITNPPYKLANEFVRHALSLCPHVFMLLRLAYLQAASRSDVLDGGQLAAVYPFVQRLPQMHRAGWDGPKSSSQMPFAWFEWNRDWRGPAIVQRLNVEGL